jgi:hypothetical protein
MKMDNSNIQKECQFVSYQIQKKINLPVAKPSTFTAFAMISREYNKQINDRNNTIVTQYFLKSRKQE